MNLFINTAVRETIKALDTLTTQKEYWERELKVTSRWNPLRRLEIKDTLNTLDTEIRVLNESLSATPALAW